MRGQFAGIALCLLALTGCANMFSIHRQDDVTPPVSDKPLLAPGAKLVLIDAKQRALTSVTRPTDSRTGAPSNTARTIVCAEPSPDALQAIAASTALSVKDEQDREAKIAQVIQENAASIGLRTQSIQLLRDAMFRICEAYQAHALGDDEVMALHRRYQNLMLGLLAIEQLTGVTKAGQVALINAGSATAGAAAADVAAAEKRVADERKALADAEEQLTNKKDEAEILATKIGSKTAEVSAEKDATKKAALQGELDKLTAQKATQDAAVTTASKKVDIQADLVKAATEAVNAARGRVSATAEGNAKIFEGMSVRGALDGQTTAAIATATHNIVKEVVNGSFLYEACFSHLDHMLKLEQVSEVQKAVLLDLLETCFSGIGSAASRLRASAPAGDVLSGGVATGGPKNNSSTAPPPSAAPENASPSGTSRGTPPGGASAPRTREKLGLPVQ